MQAFYGAKSSKEGIFSIRRVGGVANKDTMFWIGESGETKFQIFDGGILKGGDMY